MRSEAGKRATRSAEREKEEARNKIRMAGWMKIGEKEEKRKKKSRNRLQESRIPDVHFKIFTFLVDPNKYNLSWIILLDAKLQSYVRGRVLGSSRRFGGMSAKLG